MSRTNHGKRAWKWKSRHRLPLAFIWEHPLTTSTLVKIYRSLVLDRYVSKPTTHRRYRLNVALQTTLCIKRYSTQHICVSGRNRAIRIPWSSLMKSVKFGMKYALKLRKNTLSLKVPVGVGRRPATLEKKTSTIVSNVMLARTAMKWIVRLKISLEKRENKLRNRPFGKARFSLEQ